MVIGTGRCRLRGAALVLVTAPLLVAGAGCDGDDRPVRAALDAERVLDHEAFEIDRTTVEEGATLELTWQEERGNLYTFERRDEGEWRQHYWLTSDKAPDGPRVWPVGERPDASAVAIIDEGTDEVQVPNDADPGRWLLCEHDPARAWCVEVTVE